MKANDVKIGGEYQARISKTLIPVRIVAEKASGGWSAINISNGRKVFISLAKLLQEMPAASGTTVTTEGSLTVVEVPPVTTETIDGTKARSNRGRKPQADAGTTEGKKALSQLDAAARVLGEATEPMTTKEMVEAMAAKGYWSSPGGKTPHATLYSAILRELQSKADASRFIKTERGHFKLRSV